MTTPVACFVLPRGRAAATLLACLAATGADAATLFSNGPVVDASGLSVLRPPAATLGWGLQQVYGNSIAEDFVVPAGGSWTVTDIDLYAWIDAPASGFRSVAWSIRAGRDINAATVVASGLTVPTDGGLLGYRVTARNPRSKANPIHDVKTDIADVGLAAGSYWLTWSIASADPFSGPWQPTTSDFALGNVKQAAGGAYFTPVDPGSHVTYSAPFQLNGVAAVPEASTVSMLLAGLAAVAVRARAGSWRRRS